MRVEGPQEYFKATFPKLANYMVHIPMSMAKNLRFMLKSMMLLN